MTTQILVINSGSSSLKYQLVELPSGRALASGLAERIGEAVGRVSHAVGDGARHVVEQPIVDHAEALHIVLSQFAEHGPTLDVEALQGVGHRVVHGGAEFREPVLITESVLAQIEELSVLAPLHNPAHVVGIRAALQIFPGLPQVAVFDTAFFASLPPAAYTYALDAEVARDLGIRRYGFHGTSHAYVSRQVAEVLGVDLADLNQVVLHLGNGCSASAIRGGVAVETSMGMTPLEGLVMGTRSGDIDPGVVFHLARVGGLSIDEIDALLNRRSGLLGLAGDNDFRALMGARAQGDPGAALAFEVAAHRLRKYVGAYAAVLGRLDTITFTAGVGENNAAIREAALSRLECLGIELDPDANAARSSEPRVISTPDSRVTVLVVPTNEELAIAQATAELADG
ncbi:acetate kinase [Micrococcales bacterium 31B]|nr:acetate kinase [Micrococcales bacterium 31B]